MTELRWTKDNSFADHNRGVVARSVGVYDVPDDVVDEYLDHRSGGWERPGESGESDESDTEETGDTADSEFPSVKFDAETFVDDTWQSVTSAISEGKVDGHLDAVREAEESRDSPRDSVLNAIDERQE